MSREEYLADPALMPLWAEVHRKLSSGRTVRTVALSGLGHDAQEALADLLGLSAYPGPDVRVRLDRLDAALSASGLDARTAAEKAIGPIGDRAAERSERARADGELWAWMKTHPVVAADPALREWAENVRAEGTGGDRAAMRALLQRALAVIALLPLEDGRPLPSLAQQATGDPHALDGATGLARLVLRALAAQCGTPRPDDAEHRRALWARFGVDCDAHSTNVLALGLRPGGEAVLDTTLRAWAAAGTAAVITLDQLRLAEGPAVDDPVVWVVENPSVLALAQRRFGPAAPPLVCVSGWPNSAAVALLRRLAAGGSRLFYHGDFDGDGIRIAAYVMAKTGALPWRMGRDDYLEACASPTTAPRMRLAVRRVTEAPWDAHLADAMRRQGESVPEEHVAHLLLDDMAGGDAG